MTFQYCIPKNINIYSYIEPTTYLLEKVMNQAAATHNFNARKEQKSNPTIASDNRVYTYQIIMEDPITWAGRIISAAQAQAEEQDILETMVIEHNNQPQHQGKQIIALTNIQGASKILKMDEASTSIWISFVAPEGQSQKERMLFEDKTLNILRKVQYLSAEYEGKTNTVKIGSCFKLIAHCGQLHKTTVN